LLSTLQAFFGHGPHAPAAVQVCLPPVEQAFTAPGVQVVFWHAPHVPSAAQVCVPPLEQGCTAPGRQAVVFWHGPQVPAAVQVCVPPLEQGCVAPEVQSSADAKKDTPSKAIPITKNPKKILNFFIFLIFKY
jgi:hypothetical protein